mgnify:CR=1 FL=1
METVLVCHSNRVFIGIHVEICDWGYLIRAPYVEFADGHAFACELGFVPINKEHVAFVQTK